MLCGQPVPRASFINQNAFLLLIGWVVISSFSTPLEKLLMTYRSRIRVAALGWCYLADCIHRAHRGIGSPNTTRSGNKAPPSGCCTAHDRMWRRRRHSRSSKLLLWFDRHVITKFDNDQVVCQILVLLKSIFFYSAGGVMSSRYMRNARYVKVNQRLYYIVL